MQYGVFEKQLFGIPPTLIQQFPETEFEAACQLANQAPYRMVLAIITYDEDITMVDGSDVRYRSILWPGQQIVRKIREG